MIDVTEVQDLSKEQKEREENLAKGSDSKKAAGHKRKAESTPTAVKASLTKKPATNGDSKPLPADPAVATGTTTDKESGVGAGALASAVLQAYRAQKSGAQPQPPDEQTPAQPAPDTPVAAPAAASGGAKQQDWREMLKEKSNRLSADDRFRIHQFFVDRFNPTPDQPTYKLKLHEEKCTDPKTGAPVKETYYLELDYNDFTSKQSKKIKRYKD